MTTDRPGSGLGPRLFAAQASIVLIGSLTLVAVALVLAPGVFRSHMDAGMGMGSMSRSTTDHVEQAFAQAISVSLAAAAAAALSAALVVSWFLTRRITRPVQRMTDAAERVAAGDYDTVVPPAGIGSEFDRLDASFNTMARELARTETRRRELLADLAHELRTPVATLDGFLEGLQDGVVPASEETWETMRDQTTRLRRLVSDVGTVSLAEERRLHVSDDPVDITAFAREVVRGWRPGYAEKGVRLSLVCDDAPALVTGDPDRLREIIDNLLSNALRHTAPAGHVEVSVTSTPSTVRIHVRDNGVGIDAADLPHVFERFYRADPARGHDNTGSGLGLAIARALVRAHDGTIEAASAGLGQGTLVTLTLPVAAKRPEST